MKTAVLTGASTGIGLEIFKGLSRSGYHVFAISRDPGRAAAAAEQVRAVAAPGVEVTSISADLGSLAEVRRAAALVKAKTPRVDVVINNAAVVPRARTVTPEGYEQAFATNVLAPLVLVHELKAALEAAAPSRVVNFFGGQPPKKVDLDDLQYGKATYDGWKAYSQTKMHDALLTVEMARRLIGAGVTANCIWPGLVNTEGMRGLSGSLGFMMFFMRPFMRSPEEGAVAPLWLAMAPELERVSGKFFGTFRGDARKEMPVPEPAKDLEAAKRLYETCERLAKIA